MRVLVVDDDPDAAAVIARALRSETYAVDVAGDGEQGVFMASEVQYDVVVLDLGLPDVDGLEVCRALRKGGLNVPILITTGRGTVADRVVGLDFGADDYLIKPFALEELLARVRALLRRSPAYQPNNLEVAGLRLDTLAHRAEREGNVIELTGKEYALLEFLMRNAGRVVSKTEIAEHVWDEDYNPFANLIEVYVVRLRKKIDCEGQSRLIHTRRGEGYILGPQAA